MTRLTFKERIAVILKAECTGSDDHDDPNCRKCSGMQEDLEQIMESDLTTARAECAALLEKAIATFQDEYGKHDDPLIGVMRGLSAMRALATLPASKEGLGESVAENPETSLGNPTRVITRLSQKL